MNGRRDAGALVLLFLATAILVGANETYLDGHAHNMGGDYSYFLPRWLGDYQWFRLNGYGTLPWFTPAFCGGVPEWANPQSMPYSLPQWLVFFVDPARAVQVAFAIYAGAGALGMWLLLRSGFGTSIEAALTGSVLFLFNGFFIARMIVGHPQFGVFMLFPWVAWLLMHRPLDAVIAGLIIALMVHSAAVAILPPLGIAWIAVGLMRRTPGYFLRFGLALVVALVLSIGKLSAMAAFASVYPRDYYTLPGYSSVAALLRAVLQSLFWRPPADGPGDIVHPVESLGLQENEYALSPVPLILIVAVLIARPSILNRNRWRLAALAVVLAVPLAVNLHVSNGWMMFLKSLPMLKSTVSLFRWTSAYIPVAVIAAALAFDRLPLAKPWMRNALATLSITVAVVFSLTGRRDVYNGFKYEPKQVVDEWHSVRDTGEVKSIDSLYFRIDSNGAPEHLAMGDNLLTAGVDNVVCYEPLFGYHAEMLPWQDLHNGPALDEANGKLNLINPACELFPAENNCRPGDRFLGSEKDAAASFLDWHPFSFTRPWRQRIADAVSAVAFVLIGIGVVWGMLARARVRRSSTATATPSG